MFVVEMVPVVAPDSVELEEPLDPAGSGEVFVSMVVEPSSWESKT